MAWTWSLNWGVITPDLIVGTCPMVPRDLGRVKEALGVSAVLSLQHDECLTHWNIDYAEMSREGRRLGLVMERIPIRDFDPRDTRRRLPDAVKALASLRTAGHHTYVHCTAGISRAPLMVFGYLTLVEGMPSEYARMLIMEARPESVPYWEACEEARVDLAIEYREAIEQRACELRRLGRSGNYDEALCRAESEILRAALSEG
jgi:hypothetical protein